MANAPVSAVLLGDGPVQITCPKCHQTVLSKVEYSSGLLTYLFCTGLFFCGISGDLNDLYGAVVVFIVCFSFLGCCLIPFCVDRLRDAKHTCPSCKTALGIHKRL